MNNNNLKDRCRRKTGDALIARTYRETEEQPKYIERTIIIEDVGPQQPGVTVTNAKKGVWVYAQQNNTGKGTY